MKDHQHTVYSISIEDIQTVATKEFGRLLTDKELEVIEDKIGDYIKWYDIIETVININLGLSHDVIDINH